MLFFIDNKKQQEPYVPTNAIKLSVPNRLALMPRRNTARFFLSVGHISLGLTPLLILMNFPVGITIFISIACFGFVHWKKNILTSQAITFSLKRLLIVVSLVLLVPMIALTTPLQPIQLWIILLTLQLPISFYDAACMWYMKPTLCIFTFLRKTV